MRARPTVLLSLLSAVVACLSVHGPARRRAVHGRGVDDLVPPSLNSTSASPSTGDPALLDLVDGLTSALAATSIDPATAALPTPPPSPTPPTQPLKGAAAIPPLPPVVHFTTAALPPVIQQQPEPTTTTAGAGSPSTGATPGLLGDPLPPLADPPRPTPAPKKDVDPLPDPPPTQPLKGAAIPPLPPVVHFTTAALPPVIQQQPEPTTTTAGAGSPSTGATPGLLGDPLPPLADPPRTTPAPKKDVDPLPDPPITEPSTTTATTTDLLGDLLPPLADPPKPTPDPKKDVGPLPDPPITEPSTTTATTTDLLGDLLPPLADPPKPTPDPKKGVGPLPYPPITEPSSQPTTTDTDTTPRTTPPPYQPPPPRTTTISINSDLSFVLTETYLAVASLTTGTGTLTDPDAATTTQTPGAHTDDHAATFTDAYGANNDPTPATTIDLNAQPVVPSLPPGIPSRIYPATQLDLKSPDLQSGAGMFTLISLLFNQELNWPFVVNSSIASSQIFAYVPPLIYTALGISSEEVKTWVLQVRIPTTYGGPADQGELGTMWLGFIPTDQVDALAAQIKAKQSKFYTGVPITAAQDLAQRVNSGFSLRSVVDPSDSGSGSGSGTDSNKKDGSSGDGKNSDEVRRDAIVGVVSSLGGITLLILVVLLYHSMKRRRELAHRRLSDPPMTSLGGGVGGREGGGGGFEDDDGIGPDGREFDRDSVGGARRRSFYFAEDSLRGYATEQQQQQQQQQEQDDAWRRTSTLASSAGSGGYGPTGGTVNGLTKRSVIIPGAISAPILRESTMNW